MKIFIHPSAIEVIKARTVVASHADVLNRGSSRVPGPRGAGTRDEPLRTSAWEARTVEGRTKWDGIFEGILTVDGYLEKI